MDVFRSCMKAVINEMFEWPPWRAKLPKDAMEYQASVLEACIPKDDTSPRFNSLQQTRVLLASVPWGDWRRRGVIEVLLVPPFDALSFEDALELVSSLLCKALTLLKLLVLKRGRWMDWEPPVSQLTLMECVFGVAGATTRRFTGVA